MTESVVARRGIVSPLVALLALAASPAGAVSRVTQVIDGLPESSRYLRAAGLGLCSVVEGRPYQHSLSALDVIIPMCVQTPNMVRVTRYMLREV